MPIDQQRKRVLLPHYTDWQLVRFSGRFLALGMASEQSDEMPLTANSALHERLALSMDSSIRLYPAACFRPLAQCLARLFHERFLICGGDRDAHSLLYYYLYMTPGYRGGKIDS